MKKWRFRVDEWTDEELSTAPLAVGYDGRDPKLLAQLDRLAPGSVIEIFHNVRGSLGMARILRSISATDFEVEMVPD